MDLVLWGSNCTTPLNRNAVWPLILLASTDVAGPRLLTVTYGQTYMVNTNIIASVWWLYSLQRCWVRVLALLCLSPYQHNLYIIWVHSLQVLTWTAKYQHLAAFWQTQDERGRHNNHNLVQRVLKWSPGSWTEHVTLDKSTQNLTIRMMKWKSYTGLPTVSDDLRPGWFACSAGNFTSPRLQLDATWAY